MKIKQVSLLSVCISFLVACSDPTIDASSPDAMKESVVKISASLSDKEKKKFSHAFNSIVITHRSHKAFKEKGDTEVIIQKRLERSLDGLNSNQVLDEYQKLRRKRGLWSLQNDEVRISEKKDDEKQLTLVTIERHKLYLENDGGQDRMFIDLVVHNGSKYNLTAVNFKTTIASSYSDSKLQKKQEIYVPIPEGLYKGKKSYKKIDLGYATANRYLPKDPTLSDYATIRITGDDVDLTTNNYPSISKLEQDLALKKSNFEEEFGL